MDSEDCVTLQLDDGTVNASRSTLVEHSDYFKAMFQGGFSESNKSIVKIEHVDVESFELILKWLFDNETHIPFKQSTELLRISAMLLFLGVKEKCRAIIMNTLSPLNCLGLWLFADSIAEHDIAARAQVMSLLEFDKVSKTKGFYKTGLRHVCKYLTDCHLKCTKESQIFDAAIEYFQHLEERKDHSSLLKLLHCVNFGENMEKVDAYVRNMKQPIQNLSKNDELALKAFLSDKKRSQLKFPTLFFIREISNSSVVNEHQDQYKRKRKYSQLGIDAYSDGSILTLLYFDTRTSEFKKMPDFECPLAMNLQGMRIVCHNAYLYALGGELEKIGSGQWNRELYIYDFIKNTWTKGPDMPKPRRHFEAVICGNFLYVLGGYGSFRMLSNEVLIYDISKGTWHEKKVTYPLNDLSQLTLCSRDNDLFIMVVTHGCGYAMHPDSTLTSYGSIDVKHEIKIEKGDCFKPLLFYDDSTFFYFKNNAVIKFCIDDGNIRKLSHVPLRSDSSSPQDLVSLIDERDRANLEQYCRYKILSTACGTTLYTIYSKDNKDFIFKSLDPETAELKTLFKTSEGGIKINNENVCLGMILGFTSVYESIHLIKATLASTVQST